MSSKKGNVYVHKKSKDGQDILCPFDDTGNKITKTEVEFEDCVEQDVVGRYAGNIEVRTESNRLDNKRL